MTISCKLLVLWLSKVKALDYCSRAKVKYLSTAASIFSSETFPVPYVSTMIETGLATPIAYASSTSHFLARPAATIFFATYLAAYVALLSTFVGSFPEKAPPP